jgi:hypothetical protein
MPDGSSHSATVDDGINSLSQADQAAFVDHIRQTAIQQQPQAQPSDSWSDDLKQAGGSLMTEAGSLAQGAGSATGIKALGDAGSWLKSNAPQPSAGYQNRGGQFVSDLGKGEYSQAALDLGHGAVAGLGNTAGVLGGFAVGGPVGAAAVAGAESLGAHANEEAKGGPVTGTHLLHAAPEAAADAAITGATGALMPEGAGLVNAAKRSALMGVSGAGQSAADQAIEKGSVDPSQVLNAGASGAASAGLAEAPGVIGRAAGQATTNVASRAYQPANDLEAQTWSRVGNDIEARRQDAVRAGQDSTDFQVANNLKTQYATDLNNLVKGLKERGADKDDVDTLRALVNQQALRHNNTLDLATDGLFNRIDDMDLPDMGGVTKDDIRNKLLDLNTISNQSFLKNGTGPWQQVLGKVGQYAGAAGALLHGNPMEMMLSLGGKHSIGATAGSLAGAGIDKMLGTNVPQIALQRLAAQRYLDQRGMTAPPVGNLSMRPGVDPVTGNAPDPVPVNQPIPAGVPTPAPAAAPSLPPLRVNTPGDVAQALQQDGGVPLATQAQNLSAASQGAAMTMPAAHMANPTWERFTANGGGVTRQQVRDAATAVYGPEWVAQMDKQSSIPNLKQAVGPIQQKLAEDAQARAMGADPNATKGAGNGVDAQGRPVFSRAAYDNAAPAYFQQTGGLATDAMLASKDPQASAVIREVANTPGRAAKLAKATELFQRLSPETQAVVRPFLFHKALLEYGPA